MEILHPDHGHVKAERMRRAQNPGAVTPEPSAHGLFAAVPLPIAARTDLSAGAKLLFGVIRSLEQGALGRCIASNQELSSRIGAPIYQVNRLLQELEDCRLIARDLDHGRRRGIRATWKPAISRISNRRIAPALPCIAPALTEKTLEKKKKKTTTYCGRSPREPGGDDEPEKSSSSFVASLPESGGTGGTHAKRSGPRRDGATPEGFPPAAEPIDPRRLTAAVARVVGLKLRRHESDPGPMDAAAAEMVIRNAARHSAGGLRWVAWAIDIAAKRQNAAKGKLPVIAWSYVRVTLTNWKKGDGESPDGWPGERAARPQQTAEQQPFNPRT